MAFEGVRAEESVRRSSYQRIGKGVKHNNVVNVRPIFEWSSTEVWLYLLFHKLPINEAYRRGLNRVGCVICPLSSELGDCLDYRLFKDKAQPFVDKLKNNLANSGIHNIDEYIKLRKWKVRAGGNRFKADSNVEFISLSPDFVAKISSPKENILEWIKVLGQFSYSIENNNLSGTIKYRGQVYSTKIIFNQDNNETDLVVKNASSDLVFIYHLKKVVNKVTHCIHCEVCEIECPTGALSVVPLVKIDEIKCVKCHKCLDFIDNGCEVVNSIKRTSGLNVKRATNNDINNRTKVNRFNTFGLRDRWLSFFFENIDSYNESSHGLNKDKQLPMFKKWLKDAEIIEQTSDTITLNGSILSKVYAKSCITVWEIIWITLCDNTDLCSWYIGEFGFNIEYSRNEIDASLTTNYPEFTNLVLGNAIKAL